MESTTELRRVFFVPRREVMQGNYPFAEPIVLVDPALAHHYHDVRDLEVLETPESPETAPTFAEAMPVFAIHRREAVLYECARAATIVRDLRRVQYAH